MKGALKIVLVIALIGAAGAGGFFLAGAFKKSPAEKPAGDAAPASSAATADAKSADAKTAPAKTADAPPPRRADAAAFTGTAYSIELAVFREKKDALEYAAEMRRRQLAAEVVETLDFGGRSWFRVRVGKFDDQDQAYARLADVQAVAGIEGVITLEKPAPALPPAAVGK